MFRKIILFPFTAVYALALNARHFAYDCGLLKSKHASIPTLVLGNLHLGGTGKTPHASAFLQILSEQLGGPQYVALLSRGYKRNTRGFALVELNAEWEKVGDEPALLKSMHPLNPIAVCEDRLKGVEEIKRRLPQVRVVILDDGLQHRSLKPHKSILLLDSRRPLKTECLLPSGNLRDLKNRSSRFDAWIISRATSSKDKELLLQTSSSPAVPVFTSSMVSSKPSDTSGNAVLVVCGIAQPQNFIIEISKEWDVKFINTYPDHHHYSKKEIEGWVRIIEELKLDAIVTTSKDAVRITPYIKAYPQITLVAIPIKVEWAEEEAINNWVDEWLESPIFATQNK